MSNLTWGFRRLIRLLRGFVLFLIDYFLNLIADHFHLYEIVLEVPRKNIFPAYLRAGSIAMCLVYNGLLTNFPIDPTI